MSVMRLLRNSALAGVLLTATFASPAGAMEIDDNERPSVPSSRVVATNVGATTATLDWGESTDNVGVQFYEVIVNGTIDISPTNTRTLEGLRPDTTYEVYVRAVDTSFNVGFRTGITRFTTQTAPDAERPSIPGRPFVGDDGVINWAPSTDNVAVVRYRLFDFDTNEELGESTSTSFTDFDVNSADFRFYVKAEDAAGNLSFRTGWVDYPLVDNERPSVPSSGIKLDSNGRTLRWGASTDNRSLIRYALYDADTNRAIASSDEPSYTFDRDVQETIRVYVRAIDGQGNLSFRTGIKEVRIGDPDRPSIPGAISYNRIGFGLIELSWAPSTDNIGVIGYRVYNADTGEAIDATVTTSIDILSEGPISIYVKAFDSAGNLSYRTGIRNIPGS